MSQTAAAEPLVVFSDHVRPFRCLGRESLSQLQAAGEEPVETEWHPFDLRARKRDDDGTVDHDVDDGKDEAYFEQVHENVARLEAEYGVEVGFEEVPEVDSRNAQQAALYVHEERPERFEAFDDAVFGARWDDRRDVGDPDVLGDVAAGVGLGAAALREAVASETWAARLERSFADAERSGVPTFAHDDHVARGAVPPSHLERLVDGA